MYTLRVLKLLERGVFVVLLYLIFVLCCALGPIAALLYPLAHDDGYIRNFFEAADRMLAAFHGKSGRWTLSVECAAANSGWLKILRWMLDTIQPGHCERAAISEHAYCRIKDKKLGHK